MRTGKCSVSEQKPYIYYFPTLSFSKAEKKHTVSLLQTLLQTLGSQFPKRLLVFQTSLQLHCTQLRGRGKETTNPGPMTPSFQKHPRYKITFTLKYTKGCAVVY